MPDKNEHDFPPGQVKHTNRSNVYTANRRGGQTSLRRGPQVTYREIPPLQLLLKSVGTNVDTMPIR